MNAIKEVLVRYFSIYFIFSEMHGQVETSKNTGLEANQRKLYYVSSLLIIYFNIFSLSLVLSQPKIDQRMLLTDSRLSITLLPFSILRLGGKKNIMQFTPVFGYLFVVCMFRRRLEFN